MYSSVQTICQVSYKRKFPRDTTHLEKMMDKNEKTWPIKLLKTLWPYKTMVKTSTQANLYLLVLEVEDALPTEI